MKKFFYIGKRLSKPPRFTDCTNSQPLCMTYTDNFGYFLDAITKAKKLICKSTAYNLEQDLTAG